MAEVVFNQTPRFCQAVTLINDADEDRFPKLLSRIAQTVHDKHVRAFTDDEEAKLQTALDVSSADLKLLLETVEFIFQQAAYYGMKATVLHGHLLSVNMGAEKAKVICEVWSNCSKSTVEKMKKHSFAPLQLDSVGWNFGLELAESAKTRVREPNAILHLNMKDNAKCDKKVLLQFNHEQLLGLYEKLETIQNQLDSLS